MRSDIDEDDGDDEVEECNYKISELWLMKTRKKILKYIVHIYLGLLYYLCYNILLFTNFFTIFMKLNNFSCPSISTILLFDVFIRMYYIFCYVVFSLMLAKNVLCLFGLVTTPTFAKSI